MKKYLLLLAIGFLGFTINVNAQGLYDCYQDQDLGWPTVEERAQSGIPAMHGIWNYKGTAKQNTDLAEYLCPFEVESGMLGYSVATGYEKNLRISMNSTQSYVPVTSFTLKDDTVLSMDVLGNKVFLTVEPGTSREEIVLCTAMNSTTLNFETCTRGLAFSGTTETAVTANRKAHNAGSKVVMSNVHYVYDQLTDKDTAETVNGPWTFTSSTATNFYTFPIVSSTGFTDLPSNNGDLATKYYVDTVGAGGFTSVNVSTTRGLEALGTSPETVGVNVSSTMGMYQGTDGQGIYQKITFDSIIVDVNHNDWTATGTLTMPIDTYVTTTFTETFQDYITLYQAEITSTVPIAILGVLDEMNATNGGVFGFIKIGLGIGRVKTPEFGKTLYSETDGIGMSRDKNFDWTGEHTFSATTTFTSDIVGLPKYKNDFGGDGSDGALNLTTGTTTIDASGSNVVTKYYTSINIDAGATSTLSNTHASGTIFIMKSQGDCTIAGGIDLTGLGATTGVTGYSVMDDSSHIGGVGGNASGSTAGIGGTGGAIFSNLFHYVTPNASNLYKKYLVVATGSSGGAGGVGFVGPGTPGIGGTGGGAIIIECAGALNFTGMISVDGGTGGNGGGSTTGGSGGGGGSAGMALVLYNTLTANIGTINARGGAGGDGGDANGGDGGPTCASAGSGAGGGSYSLAGKAGVVGALDNSNGTAGTASVGAEGASGGSGGGGRNGGTAGTGGAGGVQGVTDLNHYLVAEYK